MQKKKHAHEPVVVFHCYQQKGRIHPHKPLSLCYLRGSSFFTRIAVSRRILGPMERGVDRGIRKAFPTVVSVGNCERS